MNQSFSQVFLSVFDDKGYDLWAIRMESYLEGLDLWEAAEEDYIVHLLPENPIIALIKNHKKRKTKKANGRSCLFSGVS